MWVLILTLHWGYGTAMTTQEFDSIETCQKAGEQWQKQIDAFTSSPFYLCVRK